MSDDRDGEHETLDDLQRRVGNLRRANGADHEAWLTPKELPGSPAVESLSIDLVPSRIRPWIKDICERHSAPVAAVAAPAIIMFAAALGTRVSVYPRASDEEWVEHANLYGAVVDVSGAGKSPREREVKRPFLELERENLATQRKERDQQRLRKSQLALAVKAQEKQLLGKEVSDKQRDHLQSQIAKHSAEIERIDAAADRPLIERATNDATPEVLVQMCALNKHGILLHQDELNAIYELLGRPSHHTLRGLLLTGHMGNQSYSVHRRTRPGDYAERLALSIYGGIQPDVLDRILARALDPANSYERDGLLQRIQILFHCDDAPRATVDCDRGADKKAAKAARDAIQRCVSMEEQAALHFAPDAQELIGEHRKRILGAVAEHAKAHPSFASHLAKFRGLVARLALIFHWIEHDDHREISAANAGLAIDWCDVLESHARRTYDRELQPGRRSALALAGKIRDGHVASGEHVRELVKNNWEGLGSDEVVRAALRVLEQHHWVRVRNVPPPPGSKGGRPAWVVDINPQLLGERGEGGM